MSDSNKDKEIKKAKSEESPHMEIDNSIIDKIKEIDPDLPDNKIKQVIKSVEMFAMSGPLPPPQILAGYENVLKGSADRIITLTELQSKHRQELEKQAVNSDILNEKIGMILAFIISMTITCGGLGLLYVGQSIVGLASVIMPLATLSGVFIYGKNSDKKQLTQQKVQLLEK
ncbi:MAG: DUF2335 domain-containing protein [Candidatus Margulisiibacteriota bacterium]